MWDFLECAKTKPGIFWGRQILNCWDFLGKTIRYEPPSLKSINQSINQSIVLLSLLQFPKTELQGVHIQLAQGGLKGIPMMLCGQQLGKKRVQGARRVGFAGHLARFQSKILYTYGHWGTLSLL